ncbi:hypothetical protein BpHYR1_004429, partial [Brachionus plicatilis]
IKNKLSIRLELIIYLIYKKKNKDLILGDRGATNFNFNSSKKEEFLFNLYLNFTIPISPNFKREFFPLRHQSIRNIEITGKDEFLCSISLVLNE